MTAQIDPITHNITMRHLAEVVIDMAHSEAGRDPRFWSLIRDHALRHAPMPPQVVTATPMEDDEARRFGRKTIGFGSYFGKQYDDVPMDYLEWLADQNAALRRYLASRRVQLENRQIDD